VRDGIISVGLEASTEPSYRFSIDIELHLREANIELCIAPLLRTL